MVAHKRSVGGLQLPLITPDSAWRTPSVPDLRRQRLVAIDTETTDEGLNAGVGPGWAFGKGQLLGVSLAWQGGSCYLPMRHPDSDCVDAWAVEGLLKQLYSDPSCTLVFMNGPYDLGWIWAEFGLAPPRAAGRIDDIGLMAVMVDENQFDYRLDAITQRLGLDGKDERLLSEAAAAYGVPPKQVKQHMGRLPARYVGPYAEVDAVQTLLARAPLWARMEAEGTLDAYAVESELIPCCFEMRRRGIRIDEPLVERSIVGLTARRDLILEDLSRRLGRRVDMEAIRSPGEMSRLCEQEHINVPQTQPKRQKNGKVAGGGRPSFSADWMQKHPHWLPRLANMAERISDAVDKFLGGYLLGFVQRGRIHPVINQFLNEGGGTRSHRFSYADPPLQQAPGSKMEKVDELGAEIVEAFRTALLPEEDELWCSPDYSQQEYRMIVHFANLNKLKKADVAARMYREDPKTDFHNFVVKLTGLDRRNAKDCNFAKAFGAGIGKFALMTGMSQERAEEVMGQYDEELPFVEQLGEKCKRLASDRGYMRLIDGARIHYNLWERSWTPGGEWYPPMPLDEARAKHKDENGRPYRLRRAYTHRAMNHMIQGSSARQTKHAMLAMWRAGVVPLLQMHDELPHSCPNKAQGELVRELMVTVMPLSIPIVVDVEYGTSWGSAKKVEAKDKTILYSASWEDGCRLRAEGPWWSTES